MAGLVPAIHGLSRSTKNMDARDKPGHDGDSEAAHGASEPPSPPRKIHAFGSPKQPLKSALFASPKIGLQTP